jgi:SNF2 family DNA or RNA helicase
MARIRHETALAKVPHAIKFIEESLESSSKIVVFAHHKDVISQLKDAFPGCVSITGDTKMEDRQAAVDRFQNDDKCRVFFGNIKAAGVGLTLTAAAHVIFVELDWVPGNMSQAEDRCHRIGQKGSVLVQHIVLSDSMDATIAKRLIQKQEIIDKALDSEVEKDQSVIPVKDFTETSRKKIVEESIDISDEECEKALAGIKLLSSFCDGANSIDGMGFSKIDARIGHSLASFNSLTKKQAVIARKLCIKYRKQTGWNND